MVNIAKYKLSDPLYNEMKSKYSDCYTIEWFAADGYSQWGVQPICFYTNGYIGIGKYNCSPSFLELLISWQPVVFHKENMQNIRELLYLLNGNRIPQSEFWNNAMKYNITTCL